MWIGILAMCTVLNSGDLECKSWPSMWAFKSEIECKIEMHKVAGSATFFFGEQFRYKCEKQ